MLEKEGEMCLLMTENEKLKKELTNEKKWQVKEEVITLKEKIRKNQTK